MPREVRSESERGLAELVATARAPFSRRERELRLADRLRGDPRLRKLVRERAETMRISGDNGLREVVAVLEALEQSGKLAGDLDQLTASARTELARAARAVALLVGPGGSTATCFFVAPDAIVTNHHVLSSRSAARGFQVRLGYERYDSPIKMCGLDPDRLFEADANLDCALVAVQGAPSGQEMIALGAGAVPAKGEQALIVQYPNGGPRKIGIDDNEIQRIEGDRLYYLTDTTEGSSGSPVFDVRMRLLALHSTGGADLVGASGKTYVENIGVCIAPIAARFQGLLTRAR